jgi:hypothetical protein
MVAYQLIRQPYVDVGCFDADLFTCDTAITTTGGNTTSSDSTSSSSSTSSSTGSGGNTGNLVFVEKLTVIQVMKLLRMLQRSVSVWLH